MIDRFTNIHQLAGYPPVACPETEHPTIPDQGIHQHWLAVWTKPRAEKVVATALGMQQDGVWLPLLTVRRRWSDRWKDVDMPLFPGYLFVQSGIDNWPTLLRIPGVLTIVKQGTSPAWIRSQQIADLRAAVDRMSMLPVAEPHVVDDFEPGERVRVVNGPMTGLVGVIREIRGSRRLLVGFEQIARALAFSLGAADVERYDHLRAIATP
jgi:transcription antitermination factor NusG